MNIDATFRFRFFGFCGSLHGLRSKNIKYAVTALLFKLGKGQRTILIIKVRVIIVLDKILEIEMLGHQNTYFLMRNRHFWSKIFILSDHPCTCILRNQGGHCILFFCPRTCPKTFLQCFALGQRKYKEKHCRNVLGHVLERKNKIQIRSLRPNQLPKYRFWLP